MLALVYADPNAGEENPNWETSEVKEDCIGRLKAAENPEEVENFQNYQTFSLGHAYILHIVT